MFDNVNLLACGQAPCAKRDMGIAYTGGVTYWLARFAAVDASYMRPAIATADGGETGYRFNSELHSHLLILGGNVGAPIGPTRIYGRVGATYHRASLRTTQTIDDSTVTIDGEEQTIEGGTQSYDLRTAGWGLLYGGGVEAWATPTFAVYFEGGLADVKGSHVDAGEGEIDDRVTYFVFGARFRFGR
jgi:hypothetical protein